MAVFTFVAKESRGTWTAKQFGGEHNLEESASSTFELQRKLVNLALQTSGPNSVSSSFSIITPTSAVAQVILGGGGVGGGVGGGGAVAPSSGGGAPAAEEAVPEKEEPKVEEESSDGDIGFSLFD